MGVKMRDDTPVSIDASPFRYRGKAENPPSSLEVLKIAAERAVGDVGRSGSVLAELDVLAVAAFRIEASGGLSRLPPRRQPLLSD
jgi:acetyl-CoA C-acetyltransferase